jgi:molybdenum cofactor cytidylyltransferase
LIVDAVVVAAGEAARLGRAKQLLPFRGTTLLGAAVEAVKAASPRRLIVVLGARAAEIRRELGAIEGAHFVENPDWRTGMGSSLRAALPHADGEGLLVALCDQPLVPASHFAALRAAFEAQPDRIIASSYEETTGVPALFPSSLRSELDGLQGGAQALIARHPRVVRLPCPEAAVDVDTEEDYRRLLELLVTG